MHEIDDLLLLKQRCVRDALMQGIARQVNYHPNSLEGQVGVDLDNQTNAQEGFENELQK